MSGVRVYNASKVRELLAAANDDTLGMPPSATARSRGGRSDGGGAGGGAGSGAAPISTRSRRSTAEVKQYEKAQRVSRHALYLKKQMEAQQAARKAISEKIVADRRKKDAEFETMYRELMDGKEFTNHIAKVLHLQETADRQKQEQLFAEWEKSVFNPICEQIAGKLDDIGHETMNKKRCEEYQKYLDVTNTGQAIFLDTVFEAEYDPFVLNRTRVKADTSKLQDPVKRILTKEAEEKTMVDPTKGEQLEQTNRGMLDVRVWHTGKIEATPHGHFAMMMNDSVGDKPGTPTEKAMKMTRSDVNFDHFRVAKGDAVTRREFPRGKRSADAIRTQMVATLAPGTRLQVPLTDKTPFATYDDPEEDSTTVGSASARK